MSALWVGILILVLLVGQGAGLWLLYRSSKRETKDSRGDGLLLLQQQMQELAKTLDTKLGEGTTRMFDSMRAQFSQSQQMVKNIEDRVSSQLLEVAKGQAESKEGTRQVLTLAEQLQNLEKVLTNQKQRGNLGERSLELVLGNILSPTDFQMQYEFPGGDTVDAVIITPEGRIPIDAKFPLENYVRMIDEHENDRRIEFENAFKQDLKKRIDETSKYVRPKDGTLPFAFMYIPAESIYYDLLNGGVGAVNTRSLIDYAQNEKKVTIVSPTTFAAYLSSVLYGFKAFKIEQAAKDIMKNIEGLSRHLKAYEDYYKKVGASLGTTVNHYNMGSKELGKINKDVLRITGSSPELEVPLLDKPAAEFD